MLRRAFAPPLFTGLSYCDSRTTFFFARLENKNKIEILVLCSLSFSEGFLGCERDGGVRFR